MAFVLTVGCRPSSPAAYQGYIEGEFVYVASPLAGPLSALRVQRGDEVKAGKVLFELEHEVEAAAVREAEQRLRQAQARLENLKKGKRPVELDALAARLDQAKAALSLSETELKRRLRLRENNVVSVEELDQVKSLRDGQKAQVEALTADLETARLGARTDEIRAAEADVAALVATFDKAKWALSQKTQSAPAEARVHDTLYRQGEWVAAGSPVVSLLPPENIKVRFFAPQTQLAALKPGQPVTVTVDGVAAPYRATVNYISTQAEFTPPVIYNRENRAKLVFMVEAVFAPADARQLRPGQPVDVRPNP